MSTFTPSKLTYLVTPPPIEVAGLTKACSRCGRAGLWELPVLGAVTAPAAVPIRPDGHVAWTGDGTHLGLPDALATWFGPPAAAAYLQRR